MHILSTPLRILFFGLFVFLVYRLNFYLSYPDYFAELSSDAIAQGFIKGIQFDSATIASVCGIFLLLLSLPFKSIQHTFFHKLLIIVASLFIFALLIYALMDISYFGEVKRHIGAEILNISADIGAITEIAFSSRRDDLLKGLILLAVLSIIWYYLVLRPSLRVSVHIPKHFFIKVLWVLVMALIVFISIRGFIFKGRPINVADAFTTQGTIQQANLSLNPAYLSFRESMNRLKQKPLNLVDGETLKQYQQQHPNVFVWQKETAQHQPKNVVIILLESWTYRYIDGLSGSSYKATPFFDSLIPQSQVWDNYYAAGQRSIVGIQAVLSAVPALPSQSSLGFGLEIKNINRIAQLANQHHYRTVMMQTSGRRSFQMENIAKALGFQEYYGKEDMPLLLDYPQDIPQFGWDHEGLQFLAHQLIEGSKTHSTQRNTSKPFFAFIFTGTTHEPFAQLPPQFELYPHSSRNENGYLNTLHYSDWALSEFFKRIENEPWYKDTIFILTADHTLNTPTDTSANRDTTARSSTISAEDFHIPLLIYTPDGSLAPKRHQTIASQYDILPTIMDLLGFKQAIYSLGQSLFDTQRADYAYLFQSDMLGMVNDKQWLFFNELGIQAEKEPANPVTLEQLNTLKLKLQFADELLRRNQWTP